jgi:hypothetical protein
MALKSTVETAMYYWPHRSLATTDAMAYAQQLEATEVVDYFWCIEVLSSWFPRAVWDENWTAMASFGDFDSFMIPL